MLKEKLRQKKVVLGSWITIGHPAIAEILAKAGFDWLVVDLEHSMISIDVAGDLIRTIDLCGVSPLVRLTSNDPNQIKRVMDAGAHGIVVPMVNTPDEAVRAVSATRYAPQGSRGVGLARAQGYGSKFSEYFSWQTDGPVVIAQVEHFSAIDNLKEIIAVPGVDGLFIGPYDLSCSMGIAGQFDHPDFCKAMERIRSIARECEFSVGVHIVEPDILLLEKAISDGYTFIAYSVDMRMLDVSARHGFSKGREAREAGQF